MTAPEPTRPTDEHTDAVARVVHRFVESHDRDEMVAELLTSTDPAVHAAMLDALVRAGHPVGDVIKAWEVAGRAPTYHRSMKAQLRKAWPTLHSALQRLSRVAP